MSRQQVLDRHPRCNSTDSFIMYIDLLCKEIGELVVGPVLQGEVRVKSNDTWSTSYHTSYPARTKVNHNCSYHPETSQEDAGLHCIIFCRVWQSSEEVKYCREFLCSIFAKIKIFLQGTSPHFRVFRSWHLTQALPMTQTCTNVVSYDITNVSGVKRRIVEPWESNSMRNIVLAHKYIKFPGKSDKPICSANDF